MLDFGARRAEVTTQSRVGKSDALAVCGRFARPLACLQTRGFARGLLRMGLTGARVARGIVTDEYPGTLRVCRGDVGVCKLDQHCCDNVWTKYTLSQSACP